MELFGYNEYEAKFMRMIEDGLAREINGSLTNDIINNLPVQNEFLATEESVEKFWNRKKKDFH